MDGQHKNLLVEKTKAAVEGAKHHMDQAEMLFRAYQNASRSEEGDRAHAENSWRLAQNNYQHLQKFLRDINQVKYVKTTLREFYYSQETAAVPGIIIVSEKSPLGQAIKNKTIGDEFELLGNKDKILGIS